MFLKNAFFLSLRYLWPAALIYHYFYFFNIDKTIKVNVNNLKQCCGLER